VPKHSLLELSDESRFLASLCPYCGDQNHSVVRRGPDILFEQGVEFQALACRRCGGWFTDGSQFASLSDYYERSYPAAYYQTASGGRSGDPGSNPSIRTTLLEHLDAPSGKRVLDVGCGNGGFPNYLRQAGLDAEGVEISPTASEYARTVYGLRVTTGILEDLPTSVRYDAITMVGTIEHLLNPQRTLAAVAQRLATGGLFVFDFPVANCLESTLAGARWWGLDMPRHTIHLTYDTATRLVGDAGMAVTARVAITRTFFHYGYLSPPSRNGFARWSIGGVAVQAVAGFLLATGRSALGAMVCRKAQV